MQALELELVGWPSWPWGGNPDSNLDTEYGVLRGLYSVYPAEKEKAEPGFLPLDLPCSAHVE